MKLKNLLSLLLAMPLLFAACGENTPDDQIENPDNPSVKEYALEITSPEVIEVNAEGGYGCIVWHVNVVVTRDEPYEPEPTFTTDAEWITLHPSVLGTFTVAANEAEAREAIIHIEFFEQVFDITVKQAGKSEDPAPEYAMDVTMAGAYRTASVQFGLPDNYFVLGFADDAENIELGLFLVGDEGTTILQAGTYTGADDTLLADECQVIVQDPAAAYSFVAGETTVAVDEEFYTFDITHNNDGTTTLEGYFESEYGNHLDLNWTGVIEGFDLNSGDVQ